MTNYDPDQRKRISLNISEFRERLDAIATRTRRNLTQTCLLAIEKGLEVLEKEIN
ncbi:MAG: hypothetical protein KME60_03355 [Cyanomargarita calcarea GSE-NOS-MK-12-04C]|jgi:predicted DNA-binding protein|uniref:Uncharacterized protein n=1 Tax=Cyanomargarita calcarea GSE-NOS-MK-12-04C TaxID=2839659 RepID=A0A951UQK0_9CYAN|nr:hypothetical protein [Cyanomargarita calcarea GSE-NOS-MK-12-04C]